MIFKWRGWEVLRLWHYNYVFSDCGTTLIMSQFTIVGLFDHHLRLHFFYKGDGDLYHNHPRHFCSIGLCGLYIEKVKIGEKTTKRPVKIGTMTWRNAKYFHNVTPIKLPCCTLAFVSPVVQQYCKK